MKLCATIDHRVLDGAHAAAMADIVRAGIEDPFAHFDRIPEHRIQSADPAPGPT